MSITVSEYLRGPARDDGLTDAEGEFYAAIHRLQDLLGVRVLRRLYPQGWVTFRDG